MSRTYEIKVVKDLSSNLRVKRDERVLLGGEGNGINNSRFGGVVVDFVCPCTEFRGGLPNAFQ